MQAELGDRHQHAESDELLVHLLPCGVAGLGKLGIVLQGAPHLRYQRFEMRVGQGDVGVGGIAAGEVGGHCRGDVVGRQTELLFELAEGVQQIGELAPHLALRVGRIGRHQRLDRGTVALHRCVGGGGTRGRNLALLRRSLALAAVEILAHRIDQVVLELVHQAVLELVVVIVVAPAIAHRIVGDNGQRKRKQQRAEQRVGDDLHGEAPVWHASGGTV